MQRLSALTVIKALCNGASFLFCCSYRAQCEDGKVEALTDALQTTVAKWKGLIPMPLPLELYTSSTFIGLFVEEQLAEVLKSFAADFATEAAAKAGLSIFLSALYEKNVKGTLDHCVFLCADVHVEPHKKQLHVTLAYHFQTSHLPILEKLAKNVDVSSGCDWLAVLFSRDIRFANHEVGVLTMCVSLPQL